MFGLIISGRPVDASPQAITETQHAFRLPASPGFNHIVVFLLPGTQLPPNSAASVYIQLPPSQDFRLLGAIGPGKESAIFQVRGLRGSASSTAAAVPLDSDGDVMTDDGTAAPDATGLSVGNGTGAGEIVVGVSIEPAPQVEMQLARLKGQAQTGGNGLGAGAGSTTSMAMVRASEGADGRVTTKLLAQRIIGNAFNFLASFGSDTVPLKAFQDWWAKFEKKIELDPSFLERGD